MGNMSPAEQRGALLRLVLIVAGAVVVSAVAGVGKTVLVVAAILLMIVLHEAGHFVMAKWAGMKVSEFFVGFGPRVWSIRRGETEYGVKVLPLGGYVKILGMSSMEEVPPEDEARTYRQQPFWRRLSVAVAGSAVHFLLAFILLVSIFFFTGDDGNLVAGTVPATNPITDIYRLTSGPSPAQQAGLHVGDRIEAINGRHFASDNQMTDFIRSRPDQRLTLTIDRHGRILDVHITPVDLAKVKVVGGDPGVKPGSAIGFIGIIGVSGAIKPVKFGFLSSINHAAGSWVSVSARTLHAFGDLVTAHGVSQQIHMLVNKQAADTTTANTPRFQSPVGIVRLAHQATEYGLSTVLYLLALINISVGIFNLLPFPPLDGGHVVVAIYERIRSRRGRPYRADAAKLLPVAYAAILLILLIAGSALFLDLRDLLS
jgi:membrane-associated protease RseP (regulator of RpoE activity)